MDIFLQIVAFIVTVLVLVSIHEWGHYLVARLLKVRVLRYAIGFGKPLFKKTSQRSGIEYVISWLPLGGYVKLLDEREGPVSEADKPHAFNRQALWKRFLIVAAGPVTNILFAIFAFWLMFLIGVEGYRPIVGQILPGTAAEAAGIDAGGEIIAFDGQPVSNWQDAMFAMMRRMGEQGVATLTTRHLKTGDQATYQIDLAKWQVDGLNPEPLRSLGILPYAPRVKPLLDTVVAGSPAAKAGLQPQDVVTQLDGKPIAYWSELARLLQMNPGKQVTLTIDRAGESITLPLEIGSKLVMSGWRTVGFIGVSVNPGKFPDDLKQVEQYGPISALAHASQETFQFFAFNFVVIKKMIKGEISLRSLGGPISIFKTADRALKQGVIVFLGFLALVSIMLAFVNVLPIPGLDGGHLLYFLIEFITGKPISLQMEVLTMRIGMALLLFMMLAATTNDLMRIVQ